jgi:superfamily II DNA or RNA helicase
MKEGFYEQIVTEALDAALAGDANRLPHSERLPETQRSMLLQRFLLALIREAMDGWAETASDASLEHMVRLANSIVDVVAENTGDPAFLAEKIQDPARVLKAFFRRDQYAHRDIREHLSAVFPVTGLTASALFTGSRSGVSLDHELKKEMLSADQIWWLVSFVKFEGVRLFEQVFQALAQQGTEVRIICTVYMGATDLKAIDFLSAFPNIRLRISYNTRHERLHAKSYLFRRDSGFHTAYIGSSNLSKSALTHGLEWNLKVTQREIPHIIDQCTKTFEIYWEDKDFIEYDPSLHREQLAAALIKGGLKVISDGGLDAFFDIKPYPFQQEMLDRLMERRAAGEMRNLVVAATGTGKTMIAAFDFRRFRKEYPSARFLFVCHREEILRQACSSFRQVLRDSGFGELWYGGQKPNAFHQLFVTIQTLNGRIDELSLASDFYDYIIIDEVHHSAAPSYRKLLDRFEPKILMGLTATPERHDGEDISRFFGHSISAELRLPEALNNGLLCPFQYFGVSDETDISRVSWRQGKYDISELEKIYSEDTRRADDILRNCIKYLRDHQDVRAIGFCVTKKHAAFMAERFRQKGLAADLLTSDQTADRRSLLDRFRRKEINYLFVVDMLNEGVDIPEIDTLLFLRPTESMTVFLQQLGRGLRKCEGKEYLTVLDFIGNAHVEYSFEHRFRAMLGKTHTRVRDEITHDFPHLPLGCSILLERTARETVLQNISQRLRGGKAKLLQAIRRFLQDFNGDHSLSNFSAWMDVPLHRIYVHSMLWFEWVAEAEGSPVLPDAFRQRLASTMAGTWLSTDSISYFGFIRESMINGFGHRDDLATRQWCLMVYLDLFDEAPGVPDHESLVGRLDDLFTDDRVKRELIEYMDLRRSEHEAIEQSDGLPFPTAMRLHGRYTRAQIIAGLGKSDLHRKFPSREGVLYVESLNTEAFFVTLDKSGMQFNPTTMYDDYFINAELFHWQSQNATSPDSPKGQSYIRHAQTGKRILLFVREANRDADELTMGFVCCGMLCYVAHEGSKPMSITWRMETPPPAMLLQAGRKLAIG